MGSSPAGANGRYRGGPAQPRFSLLSFVLPPALSTDELAAPSASEPAREPCASSRSIAAAARIKPRLEERKKSVHLQHKGQRRGRARKVPAATVSRWGDGDSGKSYLNLKKISCFLPSPSRVPAYFMPDLFTRGHLRLHTGRIETLAIGFPLFQPIGRGGAQKYPSESPGSAHRTPLAY